MCHDCLLVDAVSLPRRDHEDCIGTSTDRHKVSVAERTEAQGHGFVNLIHSALSRKSLVRRSSLGRNFNGERMGQNVIRITLDPTIELEIAFEFFMASDRSIYLAASKETLQDEPGELNWIGLLRDHGKHMGCFICFQGTNLKAPKELLVRKRQTKVEPALFRWSNASGPFS